MVRSKTNFFSYCGIIRRHKDKWNRIITEPQTVVSLCYRPAELILGKTAYGVEVDMWSAGCVIAELFTKEILMPASFKLFLLH